MAIRRAISVVARSVILLCLLSQLAADDGGFVPMERRDFEILNMISGGGSEEQSTEKGKVDEGVRDDAMATSAAEVASLQTMYRHGSGDPSVGVPQPSEDGQDLPVDDCVPACVATCAPKCVKEENKPDLCSDECNTFCERDCQEKSDAAGKPVKIQDGDEDEDENEDEEDKEGNQEGGGGGGDEEDEEDEEDKKERGEWDDEGSEEEKSGAGESEEHDNDDQGEEEEDGVRAADKPASPRGKDEEEDEARDGQGPGEGAVSQLGEDKGFGFGSTGDALFPWQQHSLDSREAGPDQCEEHCQFECVRECEVGYDKPHKCKDECKQSCENYCAPVTGKILARSDGQTGANRERDERLGRASAQKNEEIRTTTTKTKKKKKTKKRAEVARPRRLFGNNPVYEWLLGSTAIVLVCGCIFFVVRNRLGKDTYVYSSVPNLPPSASV